MFLLRSIEWWLSLVWVMAPSLPALLRSAGSKAPARRGVLGSCWLSSYPGPVVIVNSPPVTAHLTSYNAQVAYDCLPFTDDVMEAQKDRALYSRCSQEEVGPTIMAPCLLVEGPWLPASP